MGPNWDKPNKPANRGATDDLRLRNVVFRNSLFENCGCNGIALKSAIAGNNKVHGNKFYDTGWSPDSASTGCTGRVVSIFERQADVYDNYVENGLKNVACLATSISKVPKKFGPFHTRFYRNTIRNCGGKRAITGGYNKSNPGIVIPKVDIFNNDVK